ncbi:MAG TPA: hypothetical protein VHL14_02720, partial [Steroidobacteraceae bacterium]|nr:hypothetical protein [Steroidobacteraceae bacterium]
MAGALIETPVALSIGAATVTVGASAATLVPKMGFRSALPPHAAVNALSASSVIHADFLGWRLILFICPSHFDQTCRHLGKVSLVYVLIGNELLFRSFAV